MRVANLVAAIVLCSSLVGCADDEPEGAFATESGSPSGAASTTASAPASDAVAEKTPLEGTWRLEQTEQDIVKHLKQAGFGHLVERFLRVEGVTPQDHWEWTFTGTDFVANWQNPDGSWKVADYGTFEVSGDRVTLIYGDSAGGNRTTFAWSIEGERLQLDWVDYTGKVYKGLPDESFWRAYLTKPLTRVS